MSKNHQKVVLVGDGAVGRAIDCDLIELKHLSEKY